MVQLNVSSTYVWVYLSSKLQYYQKLDFELYFPAVLFFINLIQIILSIKNDYICVLKIIHVYLVVCV